MAFETCCRRFVATPLEERSAGILRAFDYEPAGSPSALGCRGLVCDRHASHRQPFLPVKPAVKLGCRIRPSRRAELSPLLCQFTQAAAQIFIARSLCHVAIGLRMRARQSTDWTLRIDLLSDSAAHSSFPQAGRQKFLPSISFNVDASSIDS